MSYLSKFVHQLYAHVREDPQTERMIACQEDIQYGYPQMSSRTLNHSGNNSAILQSNNLVNGDISNAQTMPMVHNMSSTMQIQPIHNPGIENLGINSWSQPYQTSQYTSTNNSTQIISPEASHNNHSSPVFPNQFINHPLYQPNTYNNAQQMNQNASVHPTVITRPHNISHQTKQYLYNYPNEGPMRPEESLNGVGPIKRKFVPQKQRNNITKTKRKASTKVKPTKKIGPQKKRNNMTKTKRRVPCKIKPPKKLWNISMNMMKKSCEKNHENKVAEIAILAESRKIQLSQPKDMNEINDLTIQSDVDPDRESDQNTIPTKESEENAKKNLVRCPNEGMNVHREVKEVLEKCCDIIYKNSSAAKEPTCEDPKTNILNTTNTKKKGRRGRRKKILTENNDIENSTKNKNGSIRKKKKCGSRKSDRDVTKKTRSSLRKGLPCANYNETKISGFDQIIAKKKCGRGRPPKEIITGEQIPNINKESIEPKLLPQKIRIENRVIRNKQCAEKKNKKLAAKIRILNSEEESTDSDISFVPKEKRKRRRKYRKNERKQIISNSDIENYNSDTSFVLEGTERIIRKKNKIRCSPKMLKSEIDQEKAGLKAMPMRNLQTEIPENEGRVVKETFSDGESSESDVYVEDEAALKKVIQLMSEPRKKSKLGKMYRRIKTISIPILLPPISDDSFKKNLPHLDDLDFSTEDDKKIGEEYNDLYPFNSSSSFDIKTVYLTMQAKAAIGKYQEAKEFCKGNINRWTIEAKRLNFQHYHCVDLLCPEFESKVGLVTNAVGGLWCVYAHFILDVNNRSDTEIHGVFEDSNPSKTYDNAAKNGFLGTHSDKNRNPETKKRRKRKRKRKDADKEIVTTFQAMKEAYMCLEEATQCPIASDVACVWLAKARLLEQRALVQAIASITVLNSVTTLSASEMTLKEKERILETVLESYLQARRFCKEGLVTPEKIVKDKRMGVIDKRSRRMLCHELNRICWRERKFIEVLKVPSILYPMIDRILVEKDIKTRNPIQSCVAENTEITFSFEPINTSSIVAELDRVNALRCVANKNEISTVNYLSSSSPSLQCSTSQEQFPLDSIEAYELKGSTKTMVENVEFVESASYSDVEGSSDIVTLESSKREEESSSINLERGMIVKKGCASDSDIDMDKIHVNLQKMQNGTHGQEESIHEDEAKEEVDYESKTSYHDEKMGTLLEESDKSEVSDLNEVYNYRQELHETSPCTLKKKTLKPYFDIESDDYNQDSDTCNATDALVTNCEESKEKSKSYANIISHEQMNEKLHKSNSEVDNATSLKEIARSDVPQLKETRVCNDSTELEEIPCSEKECIKNPLHSTNETIELIKSVPGSSVIDLEVLTKCDNNPKLDHTCSNLMELVKLSCLGNELYHEDTNKDYFYVKDTFEEADVRQERKFFPPNSEGKLYFDVEWANKFSNEDSAPRKVDERTMEFGAVSTLNKTNIKPKRKKWENFPFDSVIHMHKATGRDVRCTEFSPNKNPLYSASFENQVGLQCKFCMKSNHFEGLQIIYPRKIKDICQSVWILDIHHFRNCIYIPSEMRQKIEEFSEHNKLDDYVVKKHWRAVAKEKGFIDALDGGIEWVD